MRNPKDKRYIKQARPIVTTTKWSAVPGFRHRGGKMHMQKWLISLFPKCGSIYVEPFAGRGNTFWQAAHGCRYGRWWLNDSYTACFFHAILTADLNLLPNSIEITDEQHWRESLKTKDPIALLLEPMLFWSGASMLYDGKASFTGAKRLPYGEKYVKYDQLEYRHRILTARAILNYCKAIVTDHEILTAHTGLSTLPWQEWQADPHAFLYIDPPYLQAVQVGYTDTMYDPEILVDFLTDPNTKCRWALSEYAHPFWVERLGQPTYKYKSHTGGTQSVGGADERVRIECVWTNEI